MCVSCICELQIKGALVSENCKRTMTTLSHVIVKWQRGRYTQSISFFLLMYWNNPTLKSLLEWSQQTKQDQSTALSRSSVEDTARLKSGGGAETDDVKELSKDYCSFYTNRQLSVWGQLSNTFSITLLIYLHHCNFIMSPSDSILPSSKNHISPHLMIMGFKMSTCDVKHLKTHWTIWRIVTQL